jgi:hypothetical protein
MESIGKEGGEKENLLEICRLLPNLGKRYRSGASVFPADANTIPLSSTSAKFRSSGFFVTFLSFLGVPQLFA